MNKYLINEIIDISFHMMFKDVIDEIDNLKYNTIKYYFNNNSLDVLLYDYTDLESRKYKTFDALSIIEVNHIIDNDLDLMYLYKLYSK